jgi:hypothetical protein
MYRIYVKDQVFNPADYYFSASINGSGRNGVPEFTLDKNFSAGIERSADDRHLSDHALLAGHNFISAGLERN